jgi:diaminobutyrate-2-oxoglutarate transaminase
VAAVAERLGALLIVDDIQAGCGRTGSFFSFEDAGLKPDLVCLAKSIGGIGLPMALLLIKPLHDQWSPGEHNGTFRGNNLAFVAATAALQLWRDPEFLAAVASSSVFIRTWIDDLVAEIGSAHVRPVGRGLMAGIAFADQKLASGVTAEAFRKKVLIETSGPHSEVIKFFPPLTIEAEVLEEGLARLKAAIHMVFQQEQIRPAA